MIVAPAGSGKTKFCEHYFNAQVDGTISEANFHQGKYNCLPVAFFENETPVPHSIDLFFDCIYRYLGGWHKTNYLRSKGLRQHHGSDDDYSEYLEKPIIKDDLSWKTRGKSQSLLLPDKWLVNRIKKSKVLGEQFCIRDCMNNKEIIVRELLEDREEFINGMAEHEFPLNSAVLPRFIEALLEASIINPSIGFTLEVFSQLIDENEKSNWTLDFEKQEATRLSEVFKKNEKTSYEYLPKLKLGGNEFYVHDLSDTQVMEVYTAVMSVVLNFIGSNFSDRIFIFDEPDAKVDPNSTTELLELFDLYNDAKSLFVTTHSLALLTRCVARKDYDILSFKHQDGHTVIKKITNNPFEIRKTIKRLLGGLDLVSSNTTVIDGFLNSAPEQFFVFAEGPSDIGAFRLAQDCIIKNRLFNEQVRKFLERAIFLNFYSDDTLPGGAGRLAILLKNGFPNGSLNRKNQKVFGIFDSDLAGLTEASRIYQSLSHRPGPGSIINIPGNNIYYLNLHVPSLMLSNASEFNLKSGPQIEHMFYHARNQLNLGFDNHFNLSKNQKSKFLNRLEQFIQNTTSREELENVFSEMNTIFSIMANAEP